MLDSKTKVAAEVQQVEWVAGADLIAMCMICHAEYPEATGTCPKCKAPTSIMRRCPACSKVVSPKHSKCVYCSELLIEAQAVPSPIIRKHRPLAKHPGVPAKAILVSVVVFCVVFISGLLLTRMRSGVEYVDKGIIGDAYSLGQAAVFQADTLTGVPAGHLTPGEVVSVTDFASLGMSKRWIQISWHDRRYYVAERDLAPLKAKQLVYGYEALRAYILGERETAHLLLASEAVEYYCKNYGQDARCGQLTWLYAQRAQAEGLRNHNQGLVDKAKRAYRRAVEQNGEFAENARQRLETLEKTGEDSQAAAPAPRPEVQIIGASRTSPRSSSIKVDHQMTIVAPGSVLVRVPPISDTAAGTTIRASLAKTVATNAGQSVPTGTPCVIRIINKSGDNLLSIELVSFLIRGREIAVTSVPIQAKSQQEASNYAFSLRAPIVLPN